jgi:methionyl-tRNA formyltransferase
MSYVAWRLWLAIRERFRPPPPPPGYSRSLYELGQEFGFPVVDVPNVNSSATQLVLRELSPDLGVSLGNRVIYEEVFSLPRLGMINLHHGRIPGYRGGPPTFWELYNGEKSMGVSVHRIDAQLDHGSVLAESEVPILKGDDPRLLMERCRKVDARLVVDVVRSLARGSVKEIPVEAKGRGVYTVPSRRELRALQRSLGKKVRHDDFRWGTLPDPTWRQEPSARNPLTARKR